MGYDIGLAIKISKAFLYTAVNRYHDVEALRQSAIEQIFAVGNFDPRTTIDD